MSNMINALDFTYVTTNVLNFTVEPTLKFVDILDH